MKHLIWAFIFGSLALPALCDTVVATRNIRTNSIITETDLKLVATDIPGGFDTVEHIVGQEARAVIYAGRPVMVKDIGPPALIERNQIVALLYKAGGLSIFAEGRSLSRAGLGDRVRIMNLSSRSTVSGTVQKDGSVLVSSSIQPTN